MVKMIYYDFSSQFNRLKEIKMNTARTRSFCTSIEVAENTEHEKGILPVEVKFNNGKKYIIVFCEPDIVSKIVKSSKNKCLAYPGIIMIDKASINRVNEVINSIIDSGYFERLVPVSDGE